LGISCELIRHSSTGATTQDASVALHLEPENILKTLIFIDEKNGKTVGIILRGDNKVNIAAVRTAIGCNKLRFARPSEVNEVSGFEIGGVPPFAIIKCDHRLIDSSLFEKKRVIGAGGHAFCGIKIAATDLRKIPQSIVASFSIC